MSRNTCQVADWPVSSPTSHPDGFPDPGQSFRTTEAENPDEKAASSAATWEAETLEKLIHISELLRLLLERKSPLKINQQCGELNPWPHGQEAFVPAVKTDVIWRFPLGGLCSFFVLVLRIHITMTRWTIAAYRLEHLSWIYPAASFFTIILFPHYIFWSENYKRRPIVTLLPNKCNKMLSTLLHLIQKEKNWLELA